MSTTAVSFRKGNTEENNAFAGVAGEIVADLGVNTQDTSNATVVLHTGNGVAGGIRMAREDMNNITTESINNLANFTAQASGGGTYWGLLRRNMSNYTTNDVNASVVEELLKSDYNIASQDASDIDTTALTGPEGSEGDNNAPGGGKKLANRMLSNLSVEGETRVKTLSYPYWLDTVNTAFLAEDNGETYQGVLHNRKTGTKKLAYADMSNVDTANLATVGAGHSGDNLAYANLTNVPYETIVDYIDDAYDAGVISDHYEHTANKSASINRFAETGLTTQYPTLKAVIDYTADVSQNYANRYLDNIINWEIASRKEKDLYKILVTIDAAGSGYSENETITLTGITHPDTTEVLELLVETVNGNGGVLVVSIKNSTVDTANGRVTKYCTSAIASTSFVDTVKGAEFTIYTEGIVSGKLMKADMTNSEINNSTNTQSAVLHYELTEDALHNVTGVNGVSGELTDSATNSFGSFSAEVETGGVVTRLSTMTTSGGTATNTSSLAVTKTKAYLNKNETIETFDTNHELLNKGEIDTAIQTAMDAAISTAVVFKGIVVDETYLPSTTASISASQTVGGTSLGTVSVTLATFETEITTSGDYEFVFDGTDWTLNNTAVDLNDYGVSYTGTEAINDTITVSYRAAVSQTPTNGDLYWISSFSSNPPAGMIAGRSGSAIWNENVTPADWSYKLDNQNAPDNATLEYSGTSTQQVLKVKLAGAHNGKANAITVENDGLYVKTPVEVPELPTLPEHTISISQTTGSGLTDIAVVQATFESLIQTVGNHVFTYDETSDPTNPSWYYNNTAVDLTDYGISFTGTPSDGDQITVVLGTASGVYHIYAQNINGSMVYSWVNDTRLQVTQ